MILLNQGNVLRDRSNVCVVIRKSCFCSSHAVMKMKTREYVLHHVCDCTNVIGSECYSNLFKNQ